MTNTITRRTPLRVLVPVPLLLAALCAASCSGGGDGPAVAQGTPAAKSRQQGGGADPFQRGLAYAKCMRAHGVTEFPDPERSNGGIRMKVDKKIMQNPKFTSASQACRSLQPGNGDNGGGGKVDATKIGPWAQCIRDNGVPNFADPKNKGNALEIDFTGTGVDPQSPAFEKALRACRSKSPGGGIIVVGKGGGRP